MEAWKECWSDGQNLSVQLSRSGHGGGPRQENHSLRYLRMERRTTLITENCLLSLVHGSKLYILI